MGGSNLNYFTFSNARSIDSVDFECLNIETSEDGYDILLSLNKSITTAEGDFNSGDFQLVVDNVITTVDEISMSENSDMILKLSVNQGLYSDQDIFLSYSGHSIVSGMDTLQAFTNVAVNKNMAESQKVPGKIQAEDFYINYGFELEDCSDTGNGLNTSYAGYGDFLVYKVHVTRSGYYRVIYRVATEKSDAEIKFQVGQINAFTSIDTMQFEATGGWQTWDVQTSEVYLDEGYYFIRLFVKQSEFNLNWFQLNFTSTAVKNTTLQNAVLMYPNPAKNFLMLSFQPPFDGNKSIQIFDLKGSLVYSIHCKENKCVIDTSELQSGMYLVQVIGDNRKQVIKLLIE